MCLFEVQYSKAIRKLEERKASQGFATKNYDGQLMAFRDLHRLNVFFELNNLNNAQKSGLWVISRAVIINF